MKVPELLLLILKKYFVIINNGFRFLIQELVKNIFIGFICQNFTRIFKKQFIKNPVFFLFLFVILRKIFIAIYLYSINIIYLFFVF